MISKFLSRVFDVAMMKLDNDNLRKQVEQYRIELADRAMSDVFVEEDVSKIYTDTIIKVSNARATENEQLKARVAELERDALVLVQCIKDTDQELVKQRELVQRHSDEEQRLFDQVLDMQDKIEELEAGSKPKTRKKTKT